MSETDLDWRAIVRSWVQQRPQEHRATFFSLFSRYVGTLDGAAAAPGAAAAQEEKRPQSGQSGVEEANRVFDFLRLHTHEVCGLPAGGLAAALCSLSSGPSLALL